MDYLPFYLPFVAIADVFTALVSERVYKQAWPPKDAMDYLEQQAGTQFNPELVKVFLWLARNDNRVPAVLNAKNLKVR
jgi:putative two-component system response regulator